MKKPRQNGGAFFVFFLGLPENKKKSILSPNINKMETNGNKTHLSESDVTQLLEIAQIAISPNTRLRGQGQIALTLRDRGFG
jgi:hypothetical protein